MIPKKKKADPDASPRGVSRGGADDENLQPSQWWKEPIPGWPEKLTITSIVTGQSILIRLDRDPPPASPENKKKGASWWIE